MAERKPALLIGAEDLTCARFACALEEGRSVALDSAALDRVRAAHAVVEELVRTGTAAYGVTTGVGAQKEQGVSPAQMREFNRRLIRAHATRVPGPTWPEPVVRGALIVLLNQYAQGASGVSAELVQLIAEKANSRQMPVVDASGSLGVSDLVALGQLADWLLSSPEAQASNLPRAKEALSLMNCNAFTLSAGALAIAELRRLMAAFDLAAAASLEGLRGHLGAIALPVNAVHRRPGQAHAAARLRHHLEGSRLWQAGEARFLQDPLSFRMISQVHGAALEVSDWLEAVWNDELNTVSDNPMIDLGTRKVYSHGNTDTTRHTLALDAMRQGLAKLAGLSGERLHKLPWPAFSGLPTGFSEEASPMSGVHFLNFGIITASLITSAKAHAGGYALHLPGPVNDGVEDTCGHASHAVQDLRRQMETCWTIAALEAATAIWAIYRRKTPPEALGRGVAALYRRMLPRLPIGREGLEIFDPASLVEALRGA